jgi:hypothetical protein
MPLLSLICQCALALNTKCRSLEELLPVMESATKASGRQAGFRAGTWHSPDGVGGDLDKSDAADAAEENHQPDKVDSSDSHDSDDDDDSEGSQKLMRRFAAYKKKRCVCACNQESIGPDKDLQLTAKYLEQPDTT